MAIDRWNPFGDMMTLRDAMDRLLQESYVRPGSAMVNGGRAAMPLDVVENDNDYVVYASMPGIKPQNVQITVQGDTLTIRGETSSSYNEPQGQQGQAKQGQSQQAQSQQGQTSGQQGENGNYLMRERRQATYFRQVTLPTNVNADKANARFEHGELILTLPKAEEAKPKQIRVQAQPEQGQIQASSHQGQQSHQTQSQQTQAQGQGKQDQTQGQQREGQQTQHIRPRES